MWTYTLRRLLLLPLTLFCIVIVNFIIINLAPGEPFSYAEISPEGTAIQKELADKYGTEQVRIWRRSFDIPPPGGESLQMTAARSIPYFKDKIVPCLDQGQHVFVSAHGNSLRSIIMELDGLSPQEVVHLELATGLPIIYHYEKGKFYKES